MIADRLDRAIAGRDQEPLQQVFTHHTIAVRCEVTHGEQLWERLLAETASYAGVLVDPGRETAHVHKLLSNADGAKSRS